MKENDFYRSFLIFRQEDAGFGNTGMPSGYVRIESREGKGKLLVTVQNLKEDRDRFDYRVYIMKCSDKGIVPVSAGLIPLQKNRGELLWEFDSDNVSGTGENIKAFNIAAVLVEHKDGVDRGIICPLASYKDNQYEWRNYLREKLNSRNTEPVADDYDACKEQDIYSRYEAGYESKYSGIGIEEVRDDYSGEGKSLYQEQMENTLDQLSLEVKDELLKEEMEEITGDFSKEVTESEYKESSTSENFESICDENRKEDEEYELQSDNESDGLFDSYENNNSVDHIDQQSINDSSQSNNNSSPVCPFIYAHNCSKEPGVNFSDICAKCSSSRGKAPGPSEFIPVQQSTSIDMNNLVKNFNNYFEQCNPFGSIRKDYRWWKVISPVQLNNILYQCNIKTPIIFNPPAMMAYYKYKYVLAGIYSDRTRGREYIVFGIPDIYGADEKPFADDTCRWVQVEGKRPQYGIFGYWLAYIEPKTGRFLTLN